MKKLTKVCLVTALVLALGGTALTAGLTTTLQEAFSDHRRSNLRDSLRLRARVTELEDALSSGLSQWMERDSRAEDVAVGAPAATEPPSEETDEVTHAGAHAPEEPTETETASPTGYRIARYGSIIGVFDEDGELLRTVNVRVDTLPAVDQKALEEGILAADRQAMMEIVGQFS